MSMSPMAETKSLTAGLPDIGPGTHSPSGPGGPGGGPFGHYGGPPHEYSHHYYPQQNSPYFPMYQPHYHHHHYHQPHSEPVRFFLNIVGF